MEEKTQEVIVETVDMANQVLKGIIENAVVTKDFLLSQIPDVIQQILLYNLVESFSLFILGLFIVIGVPIIVYKITEVAVEKTGDSGLYVFNMASILAIFGVACLNLTWLKIWLAPKLYLIEYAANLVK